MNCCPQCFNDTEIQSIIRELAASEVGTCDYCSSTNQPIISTRDIFDSFEPLMELYEIDINGENLCTLLNRDWNIFVTDCLCNNIMQDILRDTKYYQLLSSNVKIEYIGNNLAIKWEDFVKEIKNTNRFFIENKVIDKDEVEKLLRYHTKTIKAGTKFYRGRICQTEYGFIKDELCKPPSGKATSGRANPEGISYFYLASEKETTIYEIGASIRDFVCIGEFELKEDIHIVALRAVRNVSPFLDDINLREYINNKDILQQFCTALSMPLRSFDPVNEYLPTQYLCEYIKYLKIEGVEYASAMHKRGINYAFFDDAKFNFIKAETIIVDNINITFDSYSRKSNAVE